jgi:sulfite exporter TauE/SafE
MTAAVVGALLMGVGLVWALGEPGADEPVLFLLPGVVLLVVGLLLRSQARTREELAGIRAQLEALGRARSQSEE